MGRTHGCHGTRACPTLYVLMPKYRLREQIIPYLHSKSFDTRTAASVALSQIFTLVPLWQPESRPTPENQDALPAPPFPEFSVQELISHGNLLLASSGKEFAKPAGILATPAEVKKARQAAMKRLDLQFLDDDDDLDIEKELAEEMDVDIDDDPNAAPVSVPVKLEDDSEFPPASPMDLEPKSAKRENTSPPTTRSGSPAAPSPTSPEAEVALPAPGLSARELNRLKRKRKPNNSAFVAPPPQSAGSKYTPAPAANAHKARLVAAEDAKAPATSRLGTPTTSDKVVIDPSKGGAVSPKAAKQSRALEVRPGSWIWDGVVRVLEVDLFSAAWEVRHGAAMALRELLKAQGACGGMHAGASGAENAQAHEKWCNDLSAKFLCVFVLDRFGDFVSDQVVAPVRETVSQTLASLLLHMPRRSVLHVHSILLQMIQQDLPPSMTNGNAKGAAAKPKRGKGGKAAAAADAEKTHVWEVRHAGLLGIKYEVAVRSDLFATPKSAAPMKPGEDAMAVDDTDKPAEDAAVKLEEDQMKREEDQMKREEAGGDFDESGKEVLRGVVEAAILG